MSDQFTDIRIVEFDEKASGLSGERALHRLVLKLDRTPPFEWTQHFEHAWERRIYMMKRRAEILGKQLVIYGMPDELEHVHLPELKKAIEETNREYAIYHANQLAEAEAEREQEARRNDALRELKGRLKFD